MAEKMFKLTNRIQFPENLYPTVSLLVKKMLIYNQVANRANNVGGEVNKWTVLSRLAGYHVARQCIWRSAKSSSLFYYSFFYL